MGQNGQNGNNQTLYMLYDKTKEASKGWSWYHHTLSLEEASKLIRDELSPKFGNSSPEGKGFVAFQHRKVLFQFFPRANDDRNREHWVLLLAWPRANAELSELWSILDDDVFRHVGSGRDDIPDGLSSYEYNPNYMKLTYVGASITMASGKSREVVENVEHRDKVDVVFYCERSTGKTEIITQPKLPKA